MRVTAALAAANLRVDRRRSHAASSAIVMITTVWTHEPVALASGERSPARSPLPATVIV